MRVLLPCLLLAWGALGAQTWRASLYPEDWVPPTNEDAFYTDAFLQDFSYAGYWYGEVDIPDVSTNVVDVTQAPYSADPSGESDATAAIQGAIEAVEAAGGGVVFLPAGTYAVSIRAGETSALRISGSNLVLRGAGADRTFLYNTTTAMRLRSILHVEPADGSNWDRLPDAGEAALITADLTGPTRYIPVDDPGKFSVGDPVIIRSLITDGWVAEHREPDWQPFSEILDGITQYRIVTAVEDEGIRIDIPTRYAFLVADGAMVIPSRSNMLSEVGLEHFSIGNKEITASSPAAWLEADGTLDNAGHGREGSPAYETHASSAIKFDRVENGWIRNVSSYRHPDNVFGTHILSNGIKLEYSSRVTVQDCFMGYGQYGGGGGNAYGYRIESNDCLFVNCEAEALRHGYSIVRIWSSGNVLHRISDRLTGKCTANEPEPIKTGSSGSDFHQWFSPSNLIDQMTVDESYFSAVHRRGVAASSTRPGHNAVTAHSVFWNFIADRAPQGYAIRTSQTKMGYVFGTGGSTPGVNNSPDQPRNLENLSVDGTPPAFRYDVGAERTAPLDLVEGVGQAADLLPQSLYLDQLERRLTPSSNPSPSRASRILVYPNPSDDGVFRMSAENSWWVSDLLGRTLLAGRGRRVDLKDFPAGIYALHVAGSSALLVRN